MTLDRQTAPPLPDWLAAELPFTRYTVRAAGRTVHVMEQGEGVPVLLVHGAQDGIIPAEHSRRLGDLLSARHDVHTLIVPSADHGNAIQASVRRHTYSGWITECDFS